MKELLGFLTSNPTVVQELIKSEVEKYKPLVYMVGQELLEIYKDYANNTELFMTTAKARKNQFDAYISVGFSEEQALTLLLNDMVRMKESIKNVSNSAGKSSKSK